MPIHLPRSNSDEDNGTFDAIETRVALLEKLFEKVESDLTRLISTLSSHTGTLTEPLGNNQHALVALDDAGHLEAQQQAVDPLFPLDVFKDR